MKIILEENDIYRAGQFVRGTIVVNLVSDVPLSECAIKMLCMAEVGWTENPGIRDEGRSFHIQRRLLEMSYIPEIPNCKLALVLLFVLVKVIFILDPEVDFYRIGRHEIPFEFLLPEK